MSVSLSDATHGNEIIAQLEKSVRLAPGTLLLANYTDLYLFPIQIKRISARYLATVPNFALLFTDTHASSADMLPKCSDMDYTLKCLISFSLSPKKHLVSVPSLIRREKTFLVSGPEHKSYFKLFCFVQTKDQLSYRSNKIKKGGRRERQ